MKNTLLAMLLIIGNSIAAFGQDSEIPLGEYTGAGVIGGKEQTVKLKASLGNLVVQKSGATNCMTLLRSTEKSGTYEEIDQYDSTGSVAKNSCKEKGFVYLQNEGGALVYSWSMDKMEAPGKSSAITLTKAGANAVKPGGTIKTVPGGKNSALGNLLLELESNIKWEAVEEKWKNERDAWIADTAKATTAAEVGDLLLLLESNVKWEAVQDKWAKRRAAWVGEVGKAATVAKLAALVAEFETAVQWKAVEDAWKKRRVAWTGEVSKAKN